jgi:hypothetical protein
MLCTERITPFSFLFCESQVKYFKTISVGKARTRWERVIQRHALQDLGILGWRRRNREREKNGDAF